MPPQIDPHAIPELSPQEKRLQSILKVVVAVLTLLILIVLGIMVYKMISPKKPEDKAIEAAAPVSIPPAGQVAVPGSVFGTVDIALPTGSEIKAVTVTAGQISVHVAQSGGADQVIILDPVTGQERGRFVLKP